MVIDSPCYYPESAFLEEQIYIFYSFQDNQKNFCLKTDNS